MAIMVGNKYHNIPGILLTRPSVLGNPYSHLEGTRAQWKVATREDAIACYKSWLKARMQDDGPELAELRRLADLARTQTADLVLLCVCAPKSCHADVVKAALEFLLANPAWSPRSTSAGPAPVPHPAAISRAR
jgi:hypothetical protein